MVRIDDGESPVSKAIKRCQDRAARRRKPQALPRHGGRNHAERLEPHRKITYVETSGAAWPSRDRVL